MNIKEAADQIKGAVRAYLSKDEHGLYRIPFRMLPFISEEEFGGRVCSVSEYTMSEIIASVYRARESSGVAEGILFLDEVNCVSETLAPAMLQFLQYKTFGMHRLPEGWIIVTAGNPPEYNRAAREFDPATLDRLIKIDVEPNLRVWQEYAALHGVHPAVTTYLDAKPGNFYKVRAGARGSKIVTSRGWEDLSRMLQVYEIEGMAVPASLPGRYLQDDEVSQDFSVYYELFRKYRDDYKITDIIAGTTDSSIQERASGASFDERVALVGLLLEAMLERAHVAIELEEALKLTRKDLLKMKSSLKGVGDMVQAVTNRINEIRESSDVDRCLKGQVGDKNVVKAERLRVLESVRVAVASNASGDEDGFDVAKRAFNEECKIQAELVKRVTCGLDNTFAFLDGAFGEDSQESLIYVTRLSADPILIRLVSEHGSAGFMKHNKSLLFTERKLELLKEIKGLEQD